MKNKRLIIFYNSSKYIHIMRINLLNAFKDKGYDIYFATPKDNYTSMLEQLGFKYYPINFNGQSQNPVLLIVLFFRYLACFRKIKPDLVLSYTFYPNILAALVARIKKVNIIVNMAGTGRQFQKNVVYRFILKVLYSLSFSNKTKIFFQNDEDYKLFLEKKIVDEQQSDVLPGSGVDINKFKPGDVYESSQTSCDFILVSRMIKPKGIEYLKNAIVELNNRGLRPKVRLLGSIEEKDPEGISLTSIREWEKEGLLEYLGEKVSVIEDMKKAKCIVLPTFYGEGVPRTLIEGLALGKPIITTDNVGSRECVIQGENGFICQPKSVSSLAESLEKLLKLPTESIVEMGKKSRKLSETKFDEKIVISKYLALVK